MAYDTCFYCGGSGTVECDCTGGVGYSADDCPVCGGDGYHTCSECHGSGMTETIDR